MNRIEELIARLCPDGVRWATLGEIGKISMCKRIFKNETRPEGDIPFYKIGTFGGVPDSYILYETYEYYKSRYPFPKKGDILISAAGTIGRAIPYDGKPAYFQDSNIVWIDNDESLVMNKFLLYWYKKVKWTTDGGTIQRLYNENIRRTKIPVPPLAVQREIVQVLDAFTALEAELEVELEARRRQYATYRDRLLAFNGRADIRWATLGEVGEFIRGSGIQKSDFTESGFGCIHYGQIHTHYGTWAKVTKSFVSHEFAARLRKASTGDLVIATTSEDDAAVAKAVAWLGDESVAVSTDAYIFQHSLNPKYVSYFFQTELFQSQKKPYITGTKVRRISGENLAKIRIPIPPIEEQARIVAILDKFDALVNDLTSGLPAEINGRRQQYEHYRNRLLTFPEAER